MKNGNKLTVIELSCCYETNFVKTCNYKILRYSKLQDLCVDKNFRVTKLYVEVSSLGVLPKNIQEFRNFCKQLHKCYKHEKKLSEVAIDDVLGMVGHSFTIVERNIPTFICNILCNYYFICE